MLATALKELGIEAEIVEQKVETQAQAEALAFPGSPTIRVNGADTDSEGAAAARSALTCRTYRWADGRLQPLPGRSRLLEALRRARDDGA